MNSRNTGVESKIFGEGFLKGLASQAENKKELWSQMKANREVIADTEYKLDRIYS